MIGIRIIQFVQTFQFAQFRYNKLNFHIFALMINQLTPALFWDTDVKTISIEDHAGFIIQRVCMLGTWEDWLLLKSQYGMVKIRAELIQARYLDKKTLNYFSLILNVPKENFRCYSFQQLVPKHWNY